MIDGIKTGNIKIPIQTELDWYISANEKTGEVKTVKIAEYRGLKFIDKGNRTYIKGSLHKFWNNGQHNYNDFNLTSLHQVIEELETRFRINPDTTQLENVEFGVNIDLPFKPDRIINSLILHRGETFKKFTQGRGVECNHAQYFIKIYDKGKQFNLKNNLLRVEVKVIKMQYFKSQNIELKNLSDLLNTEILQALGELLTRTINEVIFTDTTLLHNAKLSDTEKLTLANGSNPNYWNALKPTSSHYSNGNSNPEYKRQRKHFYRELARFEKLLSQHNSELKPETVKKIGDKFTDLLTENRQIGHAIKRDKFTDPLKGKGTNLPLVYSVSLSPTVKTCPISGLDISMQKPSSKFLSVTGIKYYFDNDPRTYKQLESKLTDKWKQQPLKIRFREIAHYIRNEFNNPRHNYTRDTTKRGAKLFEDTPYFSERLKKSIYGKVC